MAQETAEVSTDVSSERRRGGGREGRRALRAQAAVDRRDTAAAYIKRGMPVYNYFSEEQIDRICQNGAKILKDIGLEFREDEESLALWRQAGAKVEGERVRCDESTLLDIVKSVPSQFTLHARNPKRSVQIGGDAMVFLPTYGPPFVRSLKEGRRYATIEDFRNFSKLTYLSPALHHNGGTLCEPTDLPVNKRHLEMLYSHVRYSDKGFLGSVTAPERAQDSVDFAKIIFGEEFTDNNAVISAIINVNSPLVFDNTMTGALKVYARANQPCIVSPFILSGAMGPVTVAGTLSQIYAESLLGAALVQLYRKGAPHIMGTFATSLSMLSGAPCFGTAESSMVQLGCGQIARRLGFPLRSSGALCGSKIMDAQAAYESAISMQTNLFAGNNVVMHTAGWLEGGLVMDYEKFVLDADQAMAFVRLATPPDTDENQLAFDALQEVGPGGHYLGCAHTQANFESAFHNSPFVDNESFERWKAEGEKDMVARAADRVERMLNEYEAPPIDEALDENLLEFIKRRKESMPDSWI